MGLLRVAIRADASAVIGTGHVRRCLALAHALAQCGADVRFVMHPLDGTSAALMQPENFPVIWLDNGLPPEDAQAAASAMDTFNPQLVVVDHYGVGAAWHIAVRSRFACKVAVIDDLADRPLIPDVVIDPNFHPDPRAKFSTLLPAGTVLLAGPRFALLSQAYEHGPRYSFSGVVRSIGIFMGGTDVGGATGAALLGCREVAGFAGPVEVVSSSLSPHFDQLQRLCARWPDTTLVADLPDLAAFFSRHDLQVGAGGGATWERCCVGVPTVACLVAENQRTVLPHLEALGALVWAKPVEDIRLAVGAAVLAMLGDVDARRALALRSRQLVDGRGAARVAAVLCCAATRELQIRAASLEDEELLLDWANDPDVRANAFQVATIEPQQHAAWFRARLAQPANCRIFVAQAPNGIAAGQVRFDWRGDGWEIGYSLDTAFRGAGLALPLLRQSLDALWQSVAPTPVSGRVKPANQASARVFRSLGFNETSSADERGTYLLFTLQPQEARQ